MATQEFIKSEKTPNGTYLVGYCECSYNDLVSVLGEPNGMTDEHKVSTEWNLEDLDGNVVTIYDWKATSFYDPSCPSVQDFRRKSSYNWHVGGKSQVHAENFKKWLDYKLKSKTS